MKSLLYLIDMTRFKKVKHSNGYWLVFVKNHPYCSINGYIPEHRVVMEKAIGRYINPTQEDVHHIDGNKTNNELTNLQLLDRLTHIRIHKGWKLIGDEWFKTCPSCQTFLKVEENFYKRKSFPFNYLWVCKPCGNKKRAEQRRDKQTIT